MPTSAQTLPRLTMTAQAFENFAEQPDNADKLLELIGGEVVEVPINGYASMIVVRCMGAVARFADAVSGGYVTGEAGGYQIGKDRYIPNGAFVAYARQQAPARHGYNPIVPDLAVEIDFPSTYQSQEQLRIKNRELSGGGDHRLGGVSAPSAHRGLCTGSAGEDPQ